jgi:hypothetical protein
MALREAQVHLLFLTSRGKDFSPKMQAQDPYACESKADRRSGTRAATRRKLFFFKIGSHKLFAQAGFKLQSS